MTGAQLDRDDSRLTENSSDFMTAGEVRRETLVRAQSSEVDDALDSSITRRPSEVQSASALFAGEIARRGHRVNEVVGGVNTGECNR